MGDIYEYGLRNSLCQSVDNCVDNNFMAVQYGNFKPTVWLRQVEDNLMRIIDWVNEQLCTYTTCFEPILVELCELNGK